jgi:hypothetical protein
MTPQYCNRPAKPKALSFKELLILQARTTAKSPEDFEPILDALGVNKYRSVLSKLLFRFQPKKRYPVPSHLVPGFLKEINDKLDLYNDAAIHGYELFDCDHCVFTTPATFLNPACVEIDIGPISVRLTLRDFNISDRPPFSLVPADQIKSAIWFYKLPPVQKSKSEAKS